MKTTLAPLALLIFIIFCLNSCRQTPSIADKNDFVIAFGSCNRTTLDQGMWAPILANEPDLFIWLGDIVYGDTHDMAYLKSLYDRQKQVPAYQQLLETTEVIGVWDDHDYGWNDAGKGYSKKDSSKLLLMDFLDIPTDHEVRERDGLYTSYTYGQTPRLIKVILLDARYFRDTLVHDNTPGRRYTANPEGDILGEVQWNWLEGELRNSEAAIHIIGSGIQFIPEEHGWEKWANFPHSRQRFFDLLNQYKPSGTVLISGDRHIAEFSLISLDEGFQVVELTSSGLTHTWSNMWDEENKYRIGEKIVKRNFGIFRIHFEDGNNEINMEVRGLGDSLFKEHKIFF